MKRFSLGMAAFVLIAYFAAGGRADTATSPPPTNEPPKKATLDDVDKKADSAQGSADTAWMLISTGLVMLMVPGLALFYGGMVRGKNILGTMMHSMVALAIVGIQWMLYGYCLAFGKSQGGIIGWTSGLLGLQDILSADGTSHATFPGTNIPILVHCMYQGMFAIITPALISGAIAERIRFGPYCLFILLWSTLVYDPLAHWVWAVQLKAAGTGVDPAGWLGKMGALDFAGGTVVHVSAGLSGLAAIFVLRKRLGYPQHAVHPNSMVLTLTGAGLLWFGWFGFNGGSALGSNGQAGAALAASQVAAAAAALSWMLAEWAHRGKPTALGVASGIVAGLVAVTPASGFVTPMGALAIGLLAGVVCYGAVCLKPFLKYDDTLDAFGVHGVGGFLGAFLTGVFVNAAFVKAGAGSEDSVSILIEKGRLVQVGVQLTACVVSVVFAFAVSYVLVSLIDRVWGFCLDDHNEFEGLDRTEHGEVGFDLGPALEMLPDQAPAEPRAADVPPNGHKRFSIVVEGPKPDELTHAWSDLCQAGPKPPKPEFKAVYPFVTTVQGNRFTFRGGEPAAMRDNLTRLFELTLPGKRVQGKVES